MNNVEQIDVRFSLENYEKLFDEIIDEFEASSPDKNRITERYSSLKKTLKAEIKSIKNVTGSELDNPDISALYYPALNESFLELKVKINASPSQKMFDCLVSGKGYITYYLSQINRVEDK